MTVPSTVCKVAYPGTGTVGPFTVPFRFLQIADLIISLLPTGASASVTLVYPTDYSVLGAGQYTGGSVSLTVAIPSTTTITIFRSPALTQATSLQTQGAYQAVSVETALDLLTMDTQALQDAQGRTLTAPVTDGPMTALPPVATRANTLLAFDGLGNPTPGTFVSPSVPGTSLLQLLDTIPLLRAVVPPPALQTYLVRGGAVLGDGGGGIYRWNSSDTTPDNGASVIAPNAGGTGRWNILVTLAKLMASSASGVVIGRGTAGTGAVEELIPTGLTVTTNSISNNEQFSGFKNKLINGNFSFWQRNTTFGANGYTADRFLLASTGTVPTVTRQTRVLGTLARPGIYFMRVVTAAGSTTASIAQRVEGVSNFAGGSITISLTCLAGAARSLAVSVTQNFGTGGSPSTPVTTAVGTISATTSLARTSVTIAVPSIAGKVMGTSTFPTDYIEINVAFPASTSETYDLYDIQAEVGPALTNFEQIPFQVMLAQCQRYYQKTFPLQITPVQNYGDFGALAWSQSVAASTTQGGMGWRFATTMRLSTSGVFLTFNPEAANSNMRGNGLDWGAPTATAGDSGVYYAATSPAGSVTGAQILLHATADQEL